MSTPTTVVAPGAQLNAHDRCDRCGAEAKSIAFKPNSQPLLFCGHHVQKHIRSLLLQGWQLSHKEI